jgi:DNA-binding GntR family transcriptional regulator
MSSPWSDDDGAAERSLRVGRVAAPLRSQALEVVRSAILDFHYEPGRRLFERELMEDLGVSRTTIREVLRELGAEGLVESLPQGGVMVVTPSVKQAREVYEVRAALEALAVRYFAERATDAQVVALRDALSVFERAAGDGGDFLAMLRSKEEAYDIVLEGAGNGPVESIQKGLRARVRALDAASLSRPGRPLAELAELRLIVQAIERRDPDGAAQATAEHVALASEAGLATLSAGAGASDIVPKDGNPTV